MLAKAKRLVAEDRVEDLGAGRFEVRGDTTTHKLAFGRNDEYPDVYCSCKSSAFGNGCSHRLAVEIYLSKRRRAA